MALERLTVRQAAQRLGVSPATVRRRIEAGELDAEREIRPQGSRYIVLLDNATAARESERAEASRRDREPSPESSEITFLRREIERLHAALEREQSLLHGEQQAHAATRQELDAAREQLRITGAHQPSSRTDQNANHDAERDTPRPRRRWWALWLR